MHATTRPTSKILGRAAFGALLGAFSALLPMTAAQASPDDLQRVEITGRRPGETPRTDVRANCPGIDQALGDRLARLQYIQGVEGLATVSFRLNGNTISDVHQNRGPRVYAADVRRAVRNLECQGDARDALFVMQIEFRDQDSATDMNRRVALMEFAPPAAGSAAGTATIDGR